MKRTHAVLLIFFLFVLLGSGTIYYLVVQKPPTTSSPSERINWAWRKSFKNYELGNLALAWNGSKLVFSATETGTPTKSPGYIIIGLDHAGGVLRDWRASGNVRGLSLDGAGKQLLAELENGRLLFSDDWGAREEPITLRNSSPGAILSPKGDFILVSATSTTSRDQQRLQALSHAGDVLWSLPDTHAGPALFPFLSKDKQILSVSKNNELVLSDGKDTVWKADLPARPVSVVSSRLEGGVIAASIGGDKGEIHFFNDNGISTGSAAFPGDAISLSCSDIGISCAALANGPKYQRLSLYTPDGKEVWRYVVKKPAMSLSSVKVTDHGLVAIAGFEEKGKWSLRAWSNKGEPLWIAPIEGGLVDFKVSWNGKRIAVITSDGRIAFYDMTDKK